MVKISLGVAQTTTKGLSIYHRGTSAEHLRARVDFGIEIDYQTSEVILHYLYIP
jgi:hypothetical protein